MRRHPLTPLAVAAATALLLAGCGTTEDTAAPETGATISITDDRGETIELDGPATDVVALEWNAVESLVSLGVMPVGAADVTGYGDYAGAAPLDDTVTDVGIRGEPSVDAIAGLAPDLVVATNDLAETAIAQIEEIAPVLVLRGADASDAIGQMQFNLDQLATATGTEDEAAAVLEEFDAVVEDGAAALEQAGLAGRGFALSDAFVIDGGSVYIRPYLTGSLLSDVTERLGLVNAWQGEGDPDYGLGQADVEGLTALGDVEFLYLGDPGADPYANELAANPIWSTLPFVQNGDVHRLPERIWPFGGPASMSAYVDAVVDALAD